MRKLTIIELIIALGIFLTNINLSAHDAAVNEEVLEDAFKIAMGDGDREDDDKVRDDDENEDRDMNRDDDDEDDDDRNLPIPKTMEELWNIIFIEVDELNPEKTKQFYQKNFPFVIEQAKKMLKNEPRWVVRHLENELDEYEEVLERKEDNPQQFERWVKYKKNEYKSMELAERLRDLNRTETTNKKEKEEIKTKTDELQKVLSILFDLRLQNQKKEIENLRREVKIVEAQIKRREANRDKIIEKKMNQMTGKEEDLEW